MQTIKYDKYTNKFLIIFSSIMSLLSLTSILLINSNIMDELNSDVYACIMIIGAIVFPISALAGWGIYIDSLIYFKRLKKYGYIIPERKKEYESKLENLIPVGTQIKSFTNRSGESIALAIISLCIIIGMIINVFMFKNKYNTLGHQLNFFMGILIFLIICWLIAALLFLRQSNRFKYKDDVESGTDRKNRRHFVEGFVAIIFCLVVSISIILIIYDCGEFMLKSK